MSRTEQIVVTGGAGFAGSHLIDYLIGLYPTAMITVADNFSYAANIKYLDDAVNSNRVTISRGDIVNLEFCQRVTQGADLVIHMAAQSHVDASFVCADQFIMTNVLGTHNILEAARRSKVPLVIHCSTDEVYGERLRGASAKEDAFNPTNPYAASKASAEMIVRSFVNAHNMDIRVVRANNLFGIRQHPEKVIPRFILQAVANRPITIHGSGEQRRCFLGVRDFCNGVGMIIENGARSGMYNIGTTQEYQMIELARLILRKVPNTLSTITHVADRPFNDQRYLIDCTDAFALGWHWQESLSDGVDDLVKWYLEKRHIWASGIWDSGISLATA